MKNVWIPIAAVFMVVALAFLIQLKFEAAFVVAVLGVVAWFLNYRGQIRGRLHDRYPDEEHFDDRFNDDQKNDRDSRS